MRLLSTTIEISVFGYPDSNSISANNLCQHKIVEFSMGVVSNIEYQHDTKKKIRHQWTFSSWCDVMWFNLIWMMFTWSPFNFNQQWNFVRIYSSHLKHLRSSWNVDNKSKPKSVSIYATTIFCRKVLLQPLHAWQCWTFITF